MPAFVPENNAALKFAVREWVVGVNPGSFEGQDISKWDTSQIVDFRFVFCGLDTATRKRWYGDTDYGCREELQSFNADIREWDMAAAEDLSKMFLGAESFNQYIGKWNLAACTSIDRMFYKAGSFNQDIDQWETGRVTSLEKLFQEAKNFNKNIGKWDTSRVTNMNAAFRNAVLFNQDIGKWNTNQATSMSGMFYNAKAFNHDLSSWDTGRVSTTAEMFYGLKSFNQNVGKWNVGQVTGAHKMFQGCTVFDQDIGRWNTGKLKTMSSMFQKATAFNQDIGKWDVSRVTSMGSMFSGALAFNRDIGKWDTRRAVSMYRMFSQAKSFNQDISKWDTGSVTNLAYIFNDASAFNGDIGEWDTSSVQSFHGSFWDATNFNQDISSWDSSLVTSIRDMFKGAINFNMDIGKWDTSKVTSMHGLFWDAKNFNQDLGQWETGQVTELSGVFANCANFNADIGSWDTSQVTTLRDTFLNAKTFNADISRWDTSRVLTFHMLFRMAEKFNQNVGQWVTNQVTTMFSTFSGAATFACDVSKWTTTRVTDMKDIFFDVPISACTKARIAATWGTNEKFPYSDWGSLCFVPHTWTVLQYALREWNAKAKSGSYGQNDIKTWDTGLITDMSFLFCGQIPEVAENNYKSYGATGCDPIFRDFNGDISNWDTSQVTTMFNTFLRASSFNQDVGKWNTNRVTVMSAIFSQASTFNQDVSKWDTGQVTTLTSAFKQAEAFDYEIGKWDVSQVVDMTSTFREALTFNQDIQKWDTRQVTSLTQTFQGAASFNQDIGRWDTQNVIQTDFTFNKAASFNQDLGDWNTVSVTSMNSMFKAAMNFNNAGIGKWETSYVTNMNNMFAGAKKFDVFVGDWDVRRVGNMTMIFKDTDLLFNTCSKYGISEKWIPNFDEKRGSVAFKTAYPNWRTSWANKDRFSTECGCLGGYVCLEGKNLKCADGYWCPYNTTSLAEQQPCPNGKYGRPSIESEPMGYALEEKACGLCEPGRKGNGVGKVGLEAGCARCPNGQTSTFGAPECYLRCTELGHYWSSDDAACLACPAGTALPTLGATSNENCTRCSAGTVAYKTGSANCLQCGVGKRSSSDRKECLVCEPGTYSLDGVACKKCDGQGEYSSDQGAVYCSVATAGHKPNADRTGQEACPENTFSMGAIDYCNVCESGFSKKGSAACTACKPGEHTDYAAKKCLTCDPGSYSSDGSTCQPCDGPGEYSSDEGSVFCSVATAGHKPNAARTAQEKCPENSFSIGRNDSCTDCESGFSQEGSAACTACKPGELTDHDAKRCVSCQPGTYSSDGSTCKPCDGAGEYSSGEGAVFCSLAAAGYKPNFSRTAQVACPKGTHSTGGVKCEDCSGPGEYTSKWGAVFCSVATAGHKPSSNRTGQVKCPENTFSIGQSDTCTICESGFSPEGSAACTACKPGERTDHASKKCLRCASGTYSSDGATCEPCDGPGEYSSEAGAVFCSVATAGHKPNEARKAQEKCPENTYSIGRSDTCTDCESGFNKEGSAACTACKPGEHTDYAAKKCLTCDPGSYSSDGSTCQPCDGPGEYSSDEGSVFCSVATAGHKPNAARTAQEKCPENSFSIGRSDTCTNCESGFSKEGSAACTACKPGERTDYAAKKCLTCNPGSYSSDGATCEPCNGPGEYSSEAGAVFCSVATAGHKPNAARKAQKKCPENTYSIGRSDTCTDCESGFSKEGSAACTACKPGERTDYAAKQCLSCDLGSYSSDGATCKPCDGPGEYSSEIGAVFCSVVTAGHKPNAARTAQEKCPENMYSIGRSDNCSACTSGFSDEGSATCTACKPGERTDYEAKKCVPCDSGRYSSDGSACKICDGAGEYSSKQAAVYCSIATAGHRPNQPRNATEKCPQNTYSLGAKDECLTCESGFSLEGSAMCTACEPGYRTDHDLNQCVKCEAGTYSTDGASCIKCDGSGEFSSSMGAVYCSVATAGYMPNEARTGQVECPENTFSVGASDTCRGCESGFSVRGSAMCTACKPGSRTDLEVKECVECEPGTYSSDGAACVKCDGPGEYASSKAAVFCSVATAGHRPNTERTAQVKCPENTFSVGAGDTCAPCKIGFSEKGSTTCTPCKPGYRTDSIAKRCVICKAGWFSSDGAACNKCDGPGEYSSSDASVYCSVASAGYIPNNARSGQEKCPKATFSIGASDSCSSCEAGENFQPSDGQSTCLSCKLCPAGTRSTRVCSPAADTVCEACPAGKVSSAGDKSCSTCTAGTYANVPNTVCEHCPAGTWSDAVGEKSDATCKPCGSGKFSSATGVDVADKCNTCPPGKQSMKVGASSSDACNDCNKGHYASQTGSTECIACGSGTISDRGGASFCKPCRAGRFASNSGLSKCVLCAGGTVSDAGADNCTMCGLGTYADDSATECWPCRAGRFGGTLGLASKFCSGPCPAGKYSGKYAEECQKCQRGKFTPLQEQETCEFCKKNMISGTDATSCVAAPGFVLGRVIKRSAKEDTPRRLATNASVIDVSVEWSVHKCPTGAVCNGGAEIDTLVLEPGFTRPTDLSLDVVACKDNVEGKPKPDSVCAGGASTGKLGESVCRNGTAGPYCATCADGYAMQDGACVICQDVGVVELVLPVLLLFGIVIGVALGVYALYRWLRKRALDFDAKMHALVEKVKIVVAFMQVASGVIEEANVRYPPVFTQLMASLAVLSFDVFAWLSIGCVVPMSFYGELVATCLTPLALALAIGLYACRITRSGKNQSSFSQNFLRLYLVVLFCVYPGVSRKVFTTFKCESFVTRVDGNGKEDCEAMGFTWTPQPYDGESLCLRSFLRDDLSLSCDEAAYTFWQVFAAIMAIIYPLGVPVLFAWLLFRTVDDADDSLAFIRAAYEADYYWWELVEVGRKLALTLVLVFFMAGSPSQIVVVLLISLVTMMVLRSYKPYESDQDDLLAAAAQGLLVIVSLIVLCIRLGVDSEDEWDDGGLDFGMVVIVVAVPVLALFLGLNMQLVKRLKRQSKVMFAELGDAQGKIAKMKKQLVDAQELVNKVMADGGSLLASYAIMHDDLSFEKQIGEGAFGAVWKGRFHGTEVVAIKTMRVGKVTKSSLRKFKAEVMAPLRHPNLVCMLGAVWDEGPDKLCIVLEFAENGALEDFIPSHAFTPVLGHQIMCDVARCLKYLHGSLTAPLIHRDIKPANILVTEALRGKVADFGESRRIEQDEMKEGTDVMTMTPVAARVRGCGERPLQYSFLSVL